MAGAVARMIGADAFTIGDDIFFAAGRYRPHSASGRELLAHELTHALQQRLGQAHPQDADLCEAEAGEAARAIGGGAYWRCSVPDQPGQLRRAATLKPGSAQITITGRAHASVPTVKNGRAHFDCSSRITADGSVILTGSQPAVGWTLGFIQVEWVDTNWLYYRGEHDHDGSIFFQRSRPPARPIKACRDVDPATDIYYTDSWNLPKVNPADAFPLTLTVSHSDKPSDGCDLLALNSKTHKNNFLREAQMEFLFCTVLTARDPAGKYHHLKSFYWNVRWQATFQPAHFADPLGAWSIVPTPKGLGQATSGVIDGEPTDSRFKGILTDAHVAGCNALIPLYVNLPPGNPCRHESTVWASFDVRK